MPYPDSRFPRPLMSTDGPLAREEYTELARDVRYLERLHKAFRERARKPISNSTTHEYQLLLEMIFASEITSVKFVSSTLNPEVYCKPSLVDAARKYLKNRETSIEIIVENPSKIRAEHAFVNALEEFGAFKILALHRKIADNLNVNFSLFDDDSYRLEPDKKMTQGVVVFGDKDGFLKLAALYEALMRFSSNYSKR